MKWKRKGGNGKERKGGNGKDLCTRIDSYVNNDGVLIRRKKVRAYYVVTMIAALQLIFPIHRNEFLSFQLA